MNIFVNGFQMKKNEGGKRIFPFIKKRGPRNFQVCTYHRVNNDHDPFFSAVPVDVFEKQMTYLASHFRACALEEVIELMKKDEVPDNAVVITFDDGYKDNYLNAFPILKRLSLPATIFLATDCIGSGRVLWHDRVFSAFRETEESFLIGYGMNPKDYPLRTLEEKLFAQKEVLKFLRSLSHNERLLWIDRLIEKLKVADRKEVADLMLTWEEVKAMQRGGISFGSHTVTHPILSRLSTEAAREEIQESKKVIEENLGVPVKTFAYPNGRKEDFTESTKIILKEMGYVCAVTTLFGTNQCGQDLFELRRGAPWEEYLPIFALKLNWYKFCF
jgi:peptidoglycan/xylan/chitin deacetylase (PgdA/CDA1 family)